MKWTKPKFSRSKVNKAGEILAAQKPSIKDRVWAYQVLTNWRACHNYPLNTFNTTLRLRVGEVDQNAIVARRLKRTPSIVGKLRRFENMRLARMQDIGGLRAIVDSIPQVRQLEDRYLNGRFHHQLALQKDYIANPKDSGYRGVHLAYKYRNKNVPDYDGLQVEIQIRTRLQHAWDCPNPS